MPGDFKPRGGSRGGRGNSRGRGRGRGGGFSKASNFANKKRSSPDDAAENDERPSRPKRVKPTATDEDEGEEEVVPTLKVDDQKNEYVAIKSNDLRRVTVSNFKESILVSIREYYESDKGILPGKKGISLPLDQFNVFVASLPLIEQALAKLGHQTVRPEYTGEPPVIKSKEEEEEVPEEEVAKAEEAEEFDEADDTELKDDKPAAEEPETRKDDDWDLDVAGYDE